MPLSPVRRTVAPVFATLATKSRTWASSSLFPIISGRSTDLTVCSAKVIIAPRSSRGCRLSFRGDTLTERKTSFPEGEQKGTRLWTLSSCSLSTLSVMRSRTLLASVEPQRSLMLFWRAAAREISSVSWALRFIPAIFPSVSSATIPSWMLSSISLAWTSSIKER